MGVGIVINPRPLVAAAVGIAFLAALDVMVDRRGRDYLSERTRWLEREVAAEQSRAEQYRRHAVSDPLDQNAAVWYRLAFAEIHRLPEDTVRVLSQAMEGTAERTIEQQDDVVRSRCREATSHRVDRALRCTHCDWLGTQGGESLWRDAMVLGRCLVLVGDVASDSDGARQSYFRALEFASDLAQADFLTNLAGLVTAKAALQGLSSMVTSSACRADCLVDMSTKLSAIEERLPTVTVGMRLATLAFAEEVQRESLSATERYPGSSLLPRHAIAAWYLSQEQPLLRRLQMATTTFSVDRRARLNGEIREDLRRRHDKLLDTAVGKWGAAMNDVDDIAREFKALQAAIAVELFTR
jgi:hypothetical protein